MIKQAFLTLLLFCVNGCNNMTMEEIRSKWKLGPEFRSSSQHDYERWTVSTGLEAKWSNGWKTGFLYRGRYNSDAEGYDKQDQGIWIEFSFPLWIKSKSDKYVELEKRTKTLENKMKN